MRLPWSCKGASVASIYFIYMWCDKARPNGRVFEPNVNLSNFLFSGKISISKYASFRTIFTNQSLDWIWDTIILIVNILNLYVLKKRFKRQSKIGCNPPSSLGTKITDCNTLNWQVKRQTLWLRREHVLWPLSPAEFATCVNKCICSGFTVVETMLLQTQLP